jgi:hypothetical protein
MPVEYINPESEIADLIQEDIDLEELAKKIVDLLLREISIESERTGR